MNGKNHRLEKFRLDYRSTIKTARSIKLLGDNSVGSRATGSFSFMKERREILVRQFIGRRATYPARETIKKTMIHRDTRSCSTVEFHRGVAAPSVKLSSINRRIEEQKEQFP